MKNYPLNVTSHHTYARTIAGVYLILLINEFTVALEYLLFIVSIHARTSVYVVVAR